MAQSRLRSIAREERWRRHRQHSIRAELDISSNGRNLQRFQGGRLGFDKLATDRPARTRYARAGCTRGADRHRYGRRAHSSKGHAREVVRQALNALEAGGDEVLADDMTRQVKAGLSDYGADPRDAKGR